MAVRIRLKKTGRKHQPAYRIVAVDSRAKRDGKVIETLGLGKVIETLGHYDPLAKDESKQVVFNRERVQYWLSVGAQPSDTVSNMIKRADIKK